MCFTFYKTLRLLEIFMKQQTYHVNGRHNIFYNKPGFSMQQDNKNSSTKSSLTIKHPLPKQALTSPLPARSGPDVVTPNFLLNLPNYMALLTK